MPGANLELDFSALNPTAAEGSEGAIAKSQGMKLTFDDGPGTGTERVLEVLADAGVRATFFMIGEAVEERPETARRVADEGHVIGNHTHTHPKLTELSPERIAWEIEHCSDAIKDATGRRPTVFRPPFGDIDERIRGLVEGVGMDVILWDVDPQDWRLPGVDAIASELRSAGDDEIVILHDGGGHTREQTVEALLQVLVPES